MIEQKKDASKPDELYHHVECSACLALSDEITTLRQQVEELNETLEEERSTFASFAGHHAAVELSYERRCEALTAERDEALKHEGQKDAWIEMLSTRLRDIVVAVTDNDAWEGSVADGIDAINKKFAETNAALDSLAQVRAAVEQIAEEMKQRVGEDQDQVPGAWLIGEEVSEWSTRLSALLQAQK
jgi:chromosome segregation ATPase